MLWDKEPEYDRLSQLSKEYRMCLEDQIELLNYSGRSFEKIKLYDFFQGLFSENY